MPDEQAFTARGGGDTDAVPDGREQLVDNYMERVKRIAPQYNLPSFSTNFLTKAIEKLQENSYDVEKALEFSCSFSIDRKSTRLNSSHSQISYAVFCLKKKQHNNLTTV